MAKSIAASATHLAYALRSARRVASAGALGVGLLAAAVRPQTATIRLPTNDESPPAFAAQRGGEVSLQRAVAIALNRYPGRVVRAEPTARGDRIVYEIRLLGDDGRVRTVHIDARTGRFL